MKTIIEGQTYQVRIGVVNETTKAGQLIGTPLTVGWQAKVDTLEVIPYLQFEYKFSGGESIGWDRPLVVPYGAPPTGFINAWVRDPNNNILAQTNEPLVVQSAAPQGIVLGYSNPKQASTDWIAWLYDTEKKSWTGDYVPEKIGTYHVFPQMSKTFLIMFKEAYNVYFNDYQYGPYVVTIPQSGTYVWDARDEKLDGITATHIKNLPDSNVLGIIRNMAWVGVGRSPSGWAIDLELEATSPTPSKVSFYTGTTLYIEQANIPYYGNYSPLIGKGQRVTCTIGTGVVRDSEGNIILEVYTARNFKYPLEYPSSAYNFTGSLSYDYWNARFTVSCSGNISPFAIVVVMVVSGPEGSLGNILERFVGPVSNRYVPFYGEGFTIELWAHPNPNKYFYTSDIYAERNILNNWQRIKSIQV